MLTMPVTIKKLFVSSSNELLEERDALESLITRKNKVWVHALGVALELQRWEHGSDVISKTRKQDDYNRAIRESDLFVLLFFSKVGCYTAEEFDIAIGHFKQHGRPLILVYSKDAPVDPASVSEADRSSVAAFKQRLNELGHFVSWFESIECLQLHLGHQLDSLFIGAPSTPGGMPRGATSIASQTGSGASVQGDGVAAGAGGVAIGSNLGNINTGSQRFGHIGGCDGNAAFEAAHERPRDFDQALYGRLKQLSVLEDLVIENAKASDLVEALDKVLIIRCEVSSREGPNRRRIDAAIDVLVEMIPEAASSLVAICKRVR